MNNRKKYAGETITILHVGDDWDVIWKGETVIHDHHPLDSASLLSLIGVDVASLPDFVSEDSDEYQQIGCMTLTEYHDWMRRRKLKAERAELKRLDERETLRAAKDEIENNVRATGAKP